MIEGDLKAPFSIVTAPRCRGGDYSFPMIIQLTLNPYLRMLSVKRRIAFFASLGLFNQGLISASLRLFFREVFKFPPGGKKRTKRNKQNNKQNKIKQKRH